ncbi:MAG: SLATT domain-containing protein [Anaerolineae bacterium]|nr:SLATT domain-containing protein [Anaerolineae bacterium]
MFNKPLPATEEFDLNKIDLQSFHDQEHSSDDINLLFRIYVSKRLESQVDFYQSRIRENQLNSDFTFIAGAFIMTLSSLIATLSAGGEHLVLSLVAALLPAIAALLASFRQLYGWDQQITIYRDSNLGLQRALLLAPDDDQIEKSNLAQLYPQLVVTSEEVFTSEVSQWGQFVSEKDRDTDKGDAISEFQQLFAPTMVDHQGNLRLSTQQMKAIQSIVAAAVPTSSGDIRIERDTMRQITSSIEVPAVKVKSEPVDEPQDESGDAASGESSNATESDAGESGDTTQSQPGDEPVG